MPTLVKPRVRPIKKSERLADLANSLSEVKSRREDIEAEWELLRKSAISLGIPEFSSSTVAVRVLDIAPSRRLNQDKVLEYFLKNNISSDQFFSVTAGAHRIEVKRI